jgi:hypothetical protein
MRSANRDLPACLCVALLALLSGTTHRVAVAEPGLATPSSSPAMGQLNIEGNGVERVVLAKRVRNADLPLHFDLDRKSVV